jgi:DNA-binding beta-propeller fold protein YncE
VGGLLATKSRDRAISAFDRRTVVKSTVAGAASLALSALKGALPGSEPVLARPRPSSIDSVDSSTVVNDPAQATPDPSRLVGYVFNAKSQDVTIFDPTTRQVLATKPLGVVVRWLSNEQRFWDGRHIWTYDFPDDTVRAIAVDPRSISVARTLSTGGTGPAHSLMLTPDRKTAWLNVAGGNYLAVLDLESGEVEAEIATGKFP